MINESPSPERRGNVIKNFLGRLKDIILNIIYVERRDLEKAYKIAEEINKFVDMIHSYFKNQFSQIIENLPEEKQKRYKEIEFKIYQVLSEIGDQVVRVRIITKPLIEEI